MLVCGKTECFKTVTHTLHLDTAADVQCLRLGETFKLHFCVKTVAVCVLLFPFLYVCEEHKGKEHKFKLDKAIT